MPSDKEPLIIRSRRVAIALALAIVVMSLVSCGSKQDPRQAAATTEANIVELLTRQDPETGKKGVVCGAMTLYAESFDPITREFHGLHITGNEGLLYAERAHLITDYEAGTITLKLVDVVTAHPEGRDKNGLKTGGLRGYREIVIDATSLDL